MRHLDPTRYRARAELGNLRSATRTTNPGCKPRLFDLISYQNDGKCSTVIVGKVEMA